MRKIFLMTFMLLFAAQVCYAAPSTLDRETADSEARQSFELCSVEGKMYSVRIIGENEKIVNDWFRAKGDDIWIGNYFAYLGEETSDTLTLQDVEVFAYNFDREYSQRINTTRDNHDGFYFVRGVNGLPDLLVSKIQIASFAFAVKIFVVKNGQLQTVSFKNDKGKLQDNRDSSFNPIVYLDDGTISLPWNTNVMPGAGAYVTVYMFDVKNLILIPAYTNKIPRS